MSEWWTYRLTSFLLFSPRTYYRTIELYNVAVWPAQIAGVLLGLAIVALLVVRWSRREQAIALLLAACWLWTAWAFLSQRYAQINWIAPWFAAAFAIQALLLVIGGVVSGRTPLPSRDVQPPTPAIALVAIVIVGYPLLAPLTHRPWATAETFGVAPDPTALATIAVLALVRGATRWLLLIIPLAWCSLTVLTLWAMKAPEAIVVAAIVVIALLLGSTRARKLPHAAGRS